MLETRPLHSDFTTARCFADLEWTITGAFRAWGEIDVPWVVWDGARVLYDAAHRPVRAERFVDGDVAREVLTFRDGMLVGAGDLALVRENGRVVQITTVSPASGVRTGVGAREAELVWADDRTVEVRERDGSAIVGRLWELDEDLFPITIERRSAVSGVVGHDRFERDERRRLVRSFTEMIDGTITADVRRLYDEADRLVETTTPLGTTRLLRDEHGQRIGSDRAGPLPRSERWALVRGQPRTRELREKTEHSTREMRETLDACGTAIASEGLGGGPRRVLRRATRAHLREILGPCPACLALIDRVREHALACAHVGSDGAHLALPDRDDLSPESRATGRCPSCGRGRTHQGEHRGSGPELVLALGRAVELPPSPVGVLGRPHRVARVTHPARGSSPLLDLRETEGVGPATALLIVEGVLYVSAGHPGRATLAAFSVDSGQCLARIALRREPHLALLAIQGGLLLGASLAGLDAHDRETLEPRGSISGALDPWARGLAPHFDPQRVVLASQLYLDVVEIPSLRFERRIAPWGDDPEDEDETVRAWNEWEHHQRRQAQQLGPIALSPTRLAIVARSRAAGVIAWDLERGERVEPNDEELLALPPPHLERGALLIDAASELAVTGHPSGAVRVWDLPDFARATAETGCDID